MYLYLGDTVHANNSIIFATTIGRIYSSSEDSNNGPLQCVTDRTPCCGIPNRQGEWFFPDGTQIWPPGFYFLQVPLFYRYRGDNGTVYLNRADVNATFPSGLFCCMVPDVTETSQILCANIGKSYSIITLY